MYLDWNQSHFLVCVNVFSVDTLSSIIQRNVYKYVKFCLVFSIKVCKQKL